MMTLDLDAIRARYDRAIEAKPSKGDYTADGIAAITDSVCDVPELIKALKAATAPETHTGTVSALQFSDGEAHGCADCCCDCCEYANLTLPEGTYITIRLDGNPPLHAGRVTVTSQEQDQ